MNFFATSIDAIRRLADRPFAAIFALLVLCTAVYLPGVLNLPVVDRTEAIWAETTRDMVSRGAWLDPRYGGYVHAFRPVGTNWAQALSSKIAGDEHARDIVVYRIPGLIAVTAVVLLLYWLSLPLVGSQTAFVAALLFGAAPLTVLLAQLAIAEGLSLLAATVAMLSLLRLYCASPDDDTRGLVIAFWLALGFGMLINALLVPILAAVTLVALWIMDQSTDLVRRLFMRKFALLGLVIAAPWLAVRALQDGIPFFGLNTVQFVAALGGAQDMKLRAWPGTFLLAATLGFLPGTALMAPALTGIWIARHQRFARFLCAWIIGYIVYLELISSKPGTYMVQVIFPALALAIAQVVVSAGRKMPPPERSIFLWPTFAFVFALLPFFALYWYTHEMPSLLTSAMIAATALLFYVSSRSGRAGELWQWTVTGTAALGFLAVTLFAYALPAIDKIWPATQLKAVIGSCNDKVPVGVIGYREPSIRFLLGADTSAQTVETVLNKNPPLTIIERRSIDAYGEALKQRGRKLTLPYTCAWSYNLMRGCNVSFLVVGQGEAAHCFENGEAICETPDIIQDASNTCN